MMYENPLISVVIPMYNAQMYISKTLESIVHQSYQNWEIIIVDNNSDDNSKKIVKEFAARDSRFKLIELAHNSGGPAKPRNIGIEHAQGEYIAFVDADDIWLPEKLEKQFEFIKTQDLNFTSCDSLLIDEKDQIIQLGKKHLLFEKLFSKNNLCDVIKNNFILTSSVLIQKDLLSKFNETQEYASVEDFDMWLRTLVLSQTRYKYQNEKLINYRVVHNSASDRGNMLKQELKANLVVSHFLLNHQEYIGCYLIRIFMHLLRKKIQVMFCR